MVLIDVHADRVVPFSGGLRRFKSPQTAKAGRRENDVRALRILRFGHRFALLRIGEALGVADENGHVVIEQFVPHMDSRPIAPLEALDRRNRYPTDVSDHTGFGHRGR